MRNLAEYPITTDEKIEALDWAIEKATAEMGDSFGDIRPAALQEVRKQLHFYRIAEGLMSTGD